MPSPFILLYEPAGLSARQDAMYPCNPYRLILYSGSSKLNIWPFHLRVSVLASCILWIITMISTPLHFSTSLPSPTPSNQLLRPRFIPLSLPPLILPVSLSPGAHFPARPLLYSSLSSESLYWASTVSFFLCSLIKYRWYYTLSQAQNICICCPLSVIAAS